MGKNYKDPAFLFYPESFLVGTMDMTDEEVGQYIRLMCRQHQKGHIPERIMQRQEEAVQEKFVKDAYGLYYNERLEHEIELRKNYVASRRANGSLGGRPKKSDYEGDVETWVNEIVPEPLRKSFLEFAEIRASGGKPIKVRSTVERLYARLQSMSRDEQKQKKIIEQSIDGGWKDIYPLQVQEKRPCYKEFQKEEQKKTEPVTDAVREQMIAKLKGA